VSIRWYSIISLSAFPLFTDLAQFLSSHAVLAIAPPALVQFDTCCVAQYTLCMWQKYTGDLFFLTWTENFSYHQTRSYSVDTKVKIGWTGHVRNYRHDRYSTWTCVLYGSRFVFHVFLLLGRNHWQNHRGRQWRRWMDIIKSKYCEHESGGSSPRNTRSEFSDNYRSAEDLAVWLALPQHHGRRRWRTKSGTRTRSCAVYSPGFGSRLIQFSHITSSCCISELQLDVKGKSNSASLLSEHWCLFLNVRAHRVAWLRFQWRKIITIWLIPNYMALWQYRGCERLADNSCWQWSSQKLILSSVEITLNIYISSPYLNWMLQNTECSAASVARFLCATIRLCITGFIRQCAAEDV